MRILLARRSKMPDDTLVLPSSAEVDAELEEVEAEVDDLDFSAGYRWTYHQEDALIGEL